MAEYRDIGQLGNNMTVQQAVDNTVRTQVFLATHDGADIRLPFMNRSFISFSYGGKFIEDFNLLVTFGGDRLQKNAYADFEDLTSDYDTINGQFYWGSHYKVNELSFTLATDAMTQIELEEFKKWFCPGEERELILSEHPNRAIMARLAAPPAISLLPFEKEVEVKVGDMTYTTSTTVYRGEINISFVMDEPHWYSKFNFIPNYVIKDTWTEAENSEKGVLTHNDKDLLKVYLEDDIPFETQLPTAFKCFLGNNSLTDGRKSGIVGTAIVGVNVVGISTSTSTGITLNTNERAYLFYSGTAPSYPIIKFTLDIQFDNEYISRPGNTLYKKTLDGTTKYELTSIIKVGGNEFHFTTPAILTGYNQALQLFNSFDSGASVEDLRAAIREGVNEFYSRAWATYCIETIEKSTSYVSTSGALTGSWSTKIKEEMRQFLPNNPTATFTFDSKTGAATVTISCRIPDSPNEFFVIEENCGDCVRSNYLRLTDRNFVGSSGVITKEDCTEVSTNESIHDFLILYKNMYL